MSHQDSQTNQADKMDKEPLLAAIDLGSNSFHMVVAQEFQGELRTLDKRGEKVQLAAGLDENNILSEEAMQRGIDCLAGFARHLQGFSPQSVSVLATNALRVARNRRDFVERAEQALGYPIEVIAGREEARLIYLGVSHTLADDAGKRLVVDIGGGSTEFIIGERFESQALESLHMGCVSYTKGFMGDGKISAKKFRKAVKQAKRELLNIQQPYKKIGWQEVVGSSGTIRATEQVMKEHGWTDHGITRKGLKKLCDWLTSFDQIEDLPLEGMKPQRKQVLIGGVAILQGIFETFDIELMHYSDGALREGALWDLIGRNQHEDVRLRTVQSMQQRFHVDTEQAERVATTAAMLIAQVENDWKLTNQASEWLMWAAELHEIGLSIAHNQFHKHGSYLVKHGDMLGFTRLGQDMLAIMIRNHRRKFALAEIELLAKPYQKVAKHLCVLLRLATLLNHSRGAVELPDIRVKVEENSLKLKFPENWFEAHPLTFDDLAAETDYLQAAGFELLVEA